jgi:hypothetical protein
VALKVIIEQMTRRFVHMQITLHAVFAVLEVSRKVTKECSELSIRSFIQS